MARVELDLDLFRPQLQAKAATLTSPRQRRMIEVFCEHVEYEVEGNLDRVMATMSPDPVFHVHHGSGDFGPKGRDAVKAAYVEMFAARTNYMEMDCRRILVDDEALMIEFKQRRILAARNVTGAAWTEVLRERGLSVDAAAHYLTEGQVVVIVPFDDQCRMMGEDTYSSGALAIRELTDDELPEAFPLHARSTA